MRSLALLLLAVMLLIGPPTQLHAQSSAQFIAQVDQALATWDLDTLNRLDKNLHLQTPLARAKSIQLLYFLGETNRIHKITRKYDLNKDPENLSIQAKMIVTQESQFWIAKSDNFLLAFDNPYDQWLSQWMIPLLELSLPTLALNYQLALPKTMKPIRIEVYSGIDQLLNAALIVPEQIDSETKNQIVALCKENRILMLSPRVRKEGYAWKNTLVHELVHYLLTVAHKNAVPFWLQEGIATFEEDRWQGNQVGQNPKHLSSDLRKALNQPLRLNQANMIETNVLDFPPAAQRLIYQQAFGLTRYLYLNESYLGLTTAIEQAKTNPVALMATAQQNWSAVQKSLTMVYENTLNSRPLETRLNEAIQKAEWSEALLLAQQQFAHQPFSTELLHQLEQIHTQVGESKIAKQYAKALRLEERLTEDENPGPTRGK